jgi:hypothetical protein
MKIEMGKQYRTGDGREVRIYTTDGGGIYPVHGAVLRDGVWSPTSWTGAGKYATLSEACADLIEVKPRIKQTIWVAMYDGYCTHFLVCPPKLSPDCRACVKVEIDCEEGEGLSDD